MVTGHTGTSGTWTDGQARAMSLSEDEGSDQDPLKCPDYVQCILSSSWHGPGPCAPLLSDVRTSSGVDGLVAGCWARAETSGMGGGRELR